MGGNSPEARNQGHNKKCGSAGEPLDATGIFHYVAPFVESLNASIGSGSARNKAGEKLVDAVCELHNAFSSISFIGSVTRPCTVFLCKGIRVSRYQGSNKRSRMEVDYFNYFNMLLRCPAWREKGRLRRTSP